TSYGSRRYISPDGFLAQVNVVLMGADRTSHHKPQYCLPGSGWRIDETLRDSIHIDRPVAYELPVTKIFVSRQFEKDGQLQTIRGVYVYWYVADGALSGDPSGFEKMWSLARTLVTTGVLQRWAYVSYFSPCNPGQEQATFERVKKLIAASVPEFQLTTGEIKAAAAR
ncbi:MAG: exosortase-associated EpsI family protein, partial [Verrucomicrobia bacterium]